MSHTSSYYADKACHACGKPLLREDGSFAAGGIVKAGGYYWHDSPECRAQIPERQTVQLLTRDPDEFEGIVDG